MWGDAVQSTYDCPQGSWGGAGSRYKSGTADIVVNGVEDSVTNAITLSSLSSAQIHIGNGAIYDRSAAMYLAEIRVSSTYRSTAWLKATYHVLANTLLTYSGTL